MSSTRYSSSRDEEPLGYASMRERQRHHKKYRKRRDEGAELDEEDDKDNEEVSDFFEALILGYLLMCNFMF